jgi:hypothetical protein
VSQFAIGKLVIAKEENDAAFRGIAPIGDSVRCGECGKIIEGPSWAINGGLPRAHWRVEWADGRKTWSVQCCLLLIEDPEAMQSEDQSATLETVC